MLLLRSGIALAVLTAALACSEAAPESAAADPAVARGRTVYLSACTACHNGDPTKDGSVGPANAGASRELLEAKILRGSYPPGYTPKRESAMMPPMPQLAGSIDDLAVFLAAAAQQAP